MGSPVCFRLEAAFFYKSCRASLTKHKQQSTRVRSNGIDPIWIQVCLSLLRVPVRIETMDLSSGSSKDRGGKGACEGIIPSAFCFLLSSSTSHLHPPLRGEDQMAWDGTISVMVQL